MKLTTTIKGRQAEFRAKKYLEEIFGYQITELNFRYKRGEIDIVAFDNNVLVFVEVKSRKNSRFGYPEEAVNENKVALLHQTAIYYLESLKWRGEIRFDIVSILDRHIILFKDAF